MSMNEPKTSTIPKSYRVKPETKAKVEALFADSGISTEGDFLEYMAQLVEMQQLKEGVASGYRKLLEEREYHQRRDQDIFMTMIQSEAAARLELTQTHEAVLSERNTAFLLQEQTIQELKTESKEQTEANERITKEYAELGKQVAQLEDISKKNDLLLEQYKEKNADLSEQLADYQATMEENKALQHQVNELKSQTEKQAEQIKQLETRHDEALERLQERLDLQRERELLKVQAEYQEKLEKAGVDATNRQQEANTQMSKLYEQINELRAQLQAPRSNAPKPREGGNKADKT